MATAALSIAPFLDDEPEALSLEWWRREEVRLDNSRRQRNAVKSEEIEEDRLRLEASSLAFALDAWKVLHHGKALKPEPYIEGLCEALDSLDDLKWLMLHFPPRTGKTILCSVIYQARRWALNPRLRLLTSSFSEKRVDTDARFMRELVKSKWFQQRWPIEFADDQNQKGRYNNTAGGYRYTVLYGSGGTGDGGDILTLDDAQCGRDMFSAADMDHDEEWLDNTWMSRRNEKTGDDESRMLFVAQRLGWRDLYNYIRVTYGSRVHVLSFEAQKTSVAVTQYWQRRGDGASWDPVEFPFTSPALVHLDRREEGDLLTKRLPLSEIETTPPSVRAAQLQQRPVRVSSGAALLYAFERTIHMAKSFAERMGATTRREAIRRALAAGWRCSTGWDHGIGTRREVCVVTMWHPAYQEIWVVGIYLNRQRTNPYQDACAVRAILDELGIPIRVVVDSRGDVGNTGKGDVGNSNKGAAAASTINEALESAVYLDGDRRDKPVLGFPIWTAKKGQGSVENGVEILNLGFGSKAILIDPAAAELATYLEAWTGGEAYKDPCDGLRYVAVPILTLEFGLGGGISGSASG